jgi:hypothetical protein
MLIMLIDQATLISFNVVTCELFELSTRDNSRPKKNDEKNPKKRYDTSVKTGERKSNHVTV